MKNFLLSILLVFSILLVVASDSTRCMGSCEDPQFTWDEDTCSCVYAGNTTANETCSIRCMSGYKLEYASGECRCVKVECESWQLLDEVDLNCVCKSSWECKAGYVWDDYYCNCLQKKTSCDLVCEEPDMLDEYSCECINAPCFKPCPSGYLLDYLNCTSCADCECIPDQHYSTSSTSYSTQCAITCPSDGYTINYENCDCVCNMKPCSEFEQFDHEMCQCVSCRKECPRGFIQNQQNCSCWDCECVPDSWPSPTECNINCEDGMVPDFLICECVKETMPSCPSGYHYDVDSCTCVCSNYEDCRDNFVWNENTCECVCPMGQVCETGFVFDYNVCSCVCEEEITCSEGFFLNEESCSCSCIETEACIDGFIWDEFTCQCVKDRKPQCDPGFIYDHDMCECVCEIILLCENHQVFDPKVCQCVCPKNIDCQGGFLNVDSCTCENSPSW